MTSFLRLVFLSLMVLLEAQANSVSLSAMEIPKPTDIVAFTNDLPPATGTPVLRSRKDIEIFLEKGKYVGKYLTREDQLAISTAEAPISGVFTDRQGLFYFWTLVSATRLYLRTVNAGAMLEITETGNHLDQ